MKNIKLVLVAAFVAVTAITVSVASEVENNEAPAAEATFSGCQTGYRYSPYGLVNGRWVECSEQSGYPEEYVRVRIRCFNPDNSTYYYRYSPYTNEEGARSGKSCDSWFHPMTSWNTQSYFDW